MAVTDAFDQITAICACIQFASRNDPNDRKIKKSLKKRSARILLQVSRLIMKKIT